MRKTLLSLLTIPLAVATLTNCSPTNTLVKQTNSAEYIEPNRTEYVEPNKTEYIEPNTQKKLHSTKLPRAPQYTKYKNNDAECAGYAILTSRDMFNTNMNYANAWDMPYHNKTIAKIKGNKELKEFDKKNPLKPGMIVAFYIPWSKYNLGKDEKGNNREWTHLAVYGGKENGKIIFYQKIHGKMEKISLEDIGKSPRAIFDEKEVFSKNLYKIKYGDTSWSIATKNGISLSDLKNLNPNMNLEKIHPNQVIKIR